MTNAVLANSSALTKFTHAIYVYFNDPQTENEFYMAKDLFMYEYIYIYIYAAETICGQRRLNYYLSFAENYCWLQIRE